MVVTCLLAAALIGADPITLRDTPPAAAHVVIEMTAKGVLKPAAPKGEAEPKPVPMKVESRFDFIDRPLSAGRVARRVNQAAVAINSAARPIASSIRPEVATLIVERRGPSVFSFSPGGPLMRSELDVIQGPADPLTLPGLLPEGPVAVGQTWEIGEDAAKALSDYEALASHTLRGKLEAADAATATVRIAGEVRGAARGGEGTVKLDGALTFDRKAGFITGLKLNRTEVRKPGQVEAGLDFTGMITVERTPAEVPPELSDSVLNAQALDASSGLALLQFAPAEGRYTLLHDREWHLFWDDARLAVLKRLDRGELLAQCNLSVGPKAGKGRHQDPAQFRDDIRKALGSRFVEWVGAGEIEREDGGYAYKVAVRGREGEQDILWYYYLLASPEGDQLLATFTLNAADASRFGDQDGQLVGSLQWKGR
jgi:hypothetical protein